MTALGGAPPPPGDAANGEHLVDLRPWSLPLHSPASLPVQLRPDRERLIVAASGELDLLTADVLRTALSDALAYEWAEVVVDLRRLTFMDGRGAHVLLHARAVYEAAGRRLSLVDGVPAVNRVLEVLDLRSAFSSAELPVPT